MSSADSGFLTTQQENHLKLWVSGVRVKNIVGRVGPVVKNILGRESIAKDFVRYYLPEEITKDLDLETLEVFSQSYLSDHLKESLSDLVIRIQLYDGKLADIYILIEHKSDMEAWTKLQLLKYMNEIWQATAKENKICLPIVIPLVFYHGKRRWKHSLEFAGLFQAHFEYYKKYISKAEKRTNFPHAGIGVVWKHLPIRSKNSSQPQPD